MTGAFLVDWVGRRPLFIMSTAGMLTGSYLCTFILIEVNLLPCFQPSACGHSQPLFSILFMTLLLEKVLLL